MSIETAQKPSLREIYATYAVYCAAEYPDEHDMNGKVNVAALERIFSPDIVVDYLGYISRKWNKLEGREAVIACMVKQAAYEFTVLEKNQKSREGGLEVHTVLQTTNGKLIFDEVYSMDIEDGNCVIKHVIAHQRMEIDPKTD